MFYRRKIILAVIQVFGSKLPQVKLYKLLLIITKRQAKAEYDFVPYLYGCYSFSLRADLETMYKKQQLIEDEDKTIHKMDDKNYFATLTEADKKILLSVHQEFKNCSSNKLIHYTYTKHPYTAIRSQVAEKILTAAELEAVKAAKPVSTETILFTIGYEGISLEEYLNRLIQNDVKLLVDVRRNALSMKFGFSKGQLQRYCENLGVEYIHIPEVGIQSDLRQGLKNQIDYDKLFASYQQDNLTQTTSYQTRILRLLRDKKRIALTCFESDICQCHRKHLADAIMDLPGWTYQLKHI